MSFATPVGLIVPDASGYPSDVGAANALPVRPDPTSAPATYSAAITGLAVASAATDVFTLTGSASKVVRLNQVSVSGTAGTAAVADVQVIKRSTANSGGTSTTPTAVPNDSTQAAATAVARAYTANPTTGTAVGVVRTQKQLFDVATGPQSSVAVGYETHANGHRPLTLRGVTEVLAINLNGVTLSSPTLDIYVEWTESDT